MRHLQYYILTITLIAGVSMMSCQKQKSDADTTDAVNVLNIQKEDNNVTNAITSLLYLAANNMKDSASLVGKTPIITYPDSTVVNNVLTINFGNTGSRNVIWDSAKVRAGIITAQWIGNFFYPKTVVTVTSKNYTVNNTPFTISQKVVCLDTNAKLQLNYKVISNDTFFSSMGYTTWHCTQIRTWNTNGTYSPFDDSYAITGMATGKNYLGEAYIYGINDTLIFKESCKSKKLIQGNATFIPQGKLVRNIHIGDGTCNSPVSISINNVNYSIFLK